MLNFLYVVGSIAIYNYIELQREFKQKKVAKSGFFKRKLNALLKKIKRR